MTKESDGRRNSLSARLAKLGVEQPEAMAVRMSDFDILVDHDEFVDELALAPDPSLALDAALSWITAAPHRAIQAWAADAGLRSRFIAVTGASVALTQFLVKHPEEVLNLADGGLWQEPTPRQEVVNRVLASVNARWENGRWIAAGDSETELCALRVAYKREVLCIAARDLTGVSDLDRTAYDLSLLADAVVETALAIAWYSVNPGMPQSRFAVIAMGKCGGRELNYVSDVDVIFVAEPFSDSDEKYLDEATKLASKLMLVCEAPTAEGTIWQVDPALRPEGKSGALVRSLEGHLAYYKRWAETWEFQALLKAREMAGDAELGKNYVESVLPFVWEAAARPNFVTDVQAMRKRVVDNIPAREQERELKLGVGGLRDVEFAVQLLQLVHGRSDVMLRSSTTLVALEALATWGYIGREDAAALASAYRFERTFEHRIQMFAMRRTHLVPEDVSDLRRIGRSMSMKGDPAESLLNTWQRHKYDARRLHEKLFYRPLLQAVVRLDASDARLTPEAAHDRLRALGFIDPDNALRHLSALSTGVSRRAAIQRTLLPVMLSWMAQTPNPDAGLLAFRRVSDALGATPWYLRLLRDESVVAERLSVLLCTSRFATELLMNAPETVSLLADDDALQPRSLDALVFELESVAKRHSDLDSKISAIRNVRQRELFRIAAADVLSMVSYKTITCALSDVADAVLKVALQAVLDEHWQDREPAIEIALIGLGRLGGRELNFGSDADVCFVYRDISAGDRAGAEAVAIVSTLQSMLTRPSNDPAFPLDLDLRPEGRQGPVARSMASYEAYYARWSLTWESQALLRARYVAGDSALGQSFITMIDQLRYPKGGLTAEQLREIRRIKARVESERLPRGADPAYHVKLGPGGIADVEWSVQVLQLDHAHEFQELRTTSTIEALECAETSNLMSSQEHAILVQAWENAGSLRNAMAVTFGKPQDSLPTSGLDLALLSHVRGFSSGAALLEDYRKHARRARQVAERVVYGKEPENLL